MYNLLEYSDNYSMTSGSLWNNYRDEMDDNNGNASEGKSFKYKTKMIVKTRENLPSLDIEVTIPVKHVSNFYRSLDLC